MGVESCYEWRWQEREEEVRGRSKRSRNHLPSRKLFFFPCIEKKPPLTQGLVHVDGGRVGGGPDLRVGDSGLEEGRDGEAGPVEVDERKGLIDGFID